MINVSYNLADQPDSVEDLGALTEDQAVGAFLAIPWQDQLTEAETLGLISPSFYLEANEDGKKFAASIVGAPPETPFEFLIMFIVEIETDGEPDELHIDSDGHDLDGVETAIRAFYRKDWDGLRTIITEGG